MFYFLANPIMAYRYILIAAAVLPAAFLMYKVYQSDHLEKESSYMLRTLVRAGILSSLLALVEERILSSILNRMVAPNTEAYNLILYFGIVAVAEESSKYIFLKANSWNSPEFNCRYDGVVYAVFVSLGFALWENISYVLNYGLTTAAARAVTAIPGHACFGVFMGVFYGIGRQYANDGKNTESVLFRICGLAVPMLLHGAYDYIASMNQPGSEWYFIPFVIIMFIISYIVVIRTSKSDRFIR